MKIAIETNNSRNVTLYIFYIFYIIIALLIFFIVRMAHYGFVCGICTYLIYDLKYLKFDCVHIIISILLTFMASGFHVRFHFTFTIVILFRRSFVKKNVLTIKFF